MILKVARNLLTCIRIMHHLSSSDWILNILSSFTAVLCIFLCEYGPRISICSIHVCLFYYFQWQQRHVRWVTLNPQAEQVSNIITWHLPVILIVSCSAYIAVLQYVPWYFFKFETPDGAYSSVLLMFLPNTSHLMVEESGCEMQLMETCSQQYPLFSKCTPSVSTLPCNRLIILTYTEQALGVSQPLVGVIE